MAFGLLLMLGGGCLLLLVVQQVRDLWSQDIPAPPRRVRPAPPATSPAWAPFTVGPGTCRADLRRQYHALARRYHPDHGGDARLMAALNARFAELMRHDTPERP